MTIPTENLDAMVQFLTDAFESSFCDHFKQAADMLRAQQARIAELEAQATIGRRAVLRLQAIEWSRPVIDRKGFLGPGCIECGRDRERGHTDKCALAAILSDARLAGMGVEP